IRFSIAHELAHSLFPDCSDETRHRHLPGSSVGDHWQLEALCNVAAAELLIPIGSLREDSWSSSSIDDLIQMRERYGVASEAMAIRMTNVTAAPSAVFCASYLEQKNRYQLDYVIGSRAWTHIRHTPSLFPVDSVVAR